MKIDNRIMRLTFWIWFTNLCLFCCITSILYAMDFYGPVDYFYEYHGFSKETVINVNSTLGVIILVIVIILGIREKREQNRKKVIKEYLLPIEYLSEIMKLTIDYIENMDAMNNYNLCEECKEKLKDKLPITVYKNPLNNYFCEHLIPNTLKECESNGK